MTIAENITTSHAGMTKVNEPRAGVGRVRLFRSLALLLLAGALTALLPLFLDTYWTRLAVFVFINIGLASACNVIGGMDGYPSDRQSVVSGKSVSVRVDLGGLRIIKKKTIKIDIT